MKRNTTYENTKYGNRTHPQRNTSRITDWTEHSCTTPTATLGTPATDIPSIPSHAAKTRFWTRQHKTETISIFTDHNDTYYVYVESRMKNYVASTTNSEQQAETVAKAIRKTTT